MTILMGILATVLGVALAVAGLSVYFVMLPISGFMVGFLGGAAAIAALLGDGFLASTFGIVVGLALGVLCAILSYFYWYAGVLLAAGFFGFVLGASILGWIGIGPDWLLFLLALALGIVFFIIAFVTYFPIFFVIVGTAFAGSAIAIGGVLVLLGQVEMSAIGTGALWQIIGGSWILWLVWVIGAFVGVGAQLSMISRISLPEDRWTSVTAQGQARAASS
ncbi:MAG: DUF4203 domain-containing protein [Hyphomicrobiales bacterium]|nr:DUF4203 domain-containing protein [Hyphomicrobiales bacterium]